MLFVVVLGAVVDEDSAAAAGAERGEANVAVVVVLAGDAADADAAVDAGSGADVASVVWGDQQTRHGAGCVCRKK